MMKTLCLVFCLVLLAACSGPIKPALPDGTQRIPVNVPLNVPPAS